MARVLRSNSPEETGALGCRVGSLLRPGDVIFLLGDLGTGKTRFAQGVALAMGAEARSPSYTLLHCYRATVPLYHADLYRLDDPDELEPLDLAETAADGVLLIEWAEAAGSIFPERLEVELSFVPGREEARAIALRPVGARYEELLRELVELVGPWT